MSDTYSRIEHAIRFIDERGAEQPKLEDVAQEVGLSTFHFQRLFRRWAGISPKRFLQFVTAENAKRLLKSSRSLLSVTYESGLSSPSRLHDLFLTVHASTPGQYRKGGAGLTTRFAFCESPFGDCFVASTANGVCWLAFIREEGEKEATFQKFRQQWPNAALIEDSGSINAVIDRIFAKARSRKAQDVTLHLHGSNFQLRVWEALLRIPPGAIATYGDVADGIGATGSARAVGGAVAQNPVAFLIPCHRVIRATGSFGNYRWGDERKRAMLAFETLQTNTDNE